MLLFEKPIAHRGLHTADCPENSMSAFRKAMECGYNIETDVHQLKTGEVVVFHDSNLKRVCGKDVKIADLTLNDIKGDNYLLPNGEHIPLFSEMLDLINGQTGILLELKFKTFFDNELEKAVYPLIKGKESWIAVQSFSPLIMKWYRENAPEFTLGILSGKRLKFLMMPYYKKINPNFIAFGIDGAQIGKKFCKKHKYNLLVWTVKSKELLEKGLENGANNVIFEDIIPEEVGFSMDKLAKLVK